MKDNSKEMKYNEMYDLLEEEIYGMLSTSGEDGRPYGIPMFYVYTGNSIYLHMNDKGKKVENMDFNNKVSFCVVGKVIVMPEIFNSKYESVIVDGVVQEVHGKEKYIAIKEFITKYGYLDSELGSRDYSTRSKVFRICINEMTGRKSFRRYNR